MIAAKQRGTALFLALLIVAVVVAVAVGLLQLQRGAINHTQMLVTAETAYLQASGAVAWAKATLVADAKSTEAASWPLTLPITVTETSNITIAAQLMPAESLFNLNSFVRVAGERQDSSDFSNRKIFANLLQQLNVGVSAADSEKVINAITAWVSMNNANSKRSYDIYEQQYIKLNPSYRSAHGFMASASELQLVAGVSAEIYAAIAPYIIALPAKTEVDLQYAPAPIVAAAANNKPERDKKNKKAKYFLLRTDVYADNQDFIFYHLLQRDGSKNNIVVKIISQSFNVM